jgi:hypothetical protein
MPNYTGMGEYIVGAWLKLVIKCDIVDYNLKSPRESLVGLNELNVLGLDFKNKTAYLCEVNTHLDGLHYKNTNLAIEKIGNKYFNMRRYANEHLSEFPTRHLMFWAPIVGAGVESVLRELKGLELIINNDYTSNVRALQELAQKGTEDTGNPAFRVFQILGHMK